jgi:hypothetical protein
VGWVHPSCSKTWFLPDQNLPELGRSGGQLLCFDAPARRTLVNPRVLKIILSIDKLTG